MKKGRIIQDHISQKMKDPEFKKAWVDLDTEFKLLEMILAITTIRHPGEGRDPGF